MSMFGAAVIGGLQTSILGALMMSSSISLIDWARMGDAVSAGGLGRFAGSLSVLDLVNLGSSLSIRSFANIGDSGYSVSSGTVVFVGSAPDPKEP